MGDNGVPDPAVAAALRNTGGRLIPHGVQLRGWTLSTTRTPILGKSEFEKLENDLGVRHLPEMTFNSNLEIKHDTGMVIRFTAQDALREWKVENLPPLQCAAADNWSKSHATRLAAGSIKGWVNAAQETAGEEFDWTFTSPYGGSARGPAGEELGWEPTEERMDRSLLMARKRNVKARDPILFYDDTELYASDLDDHGACQMAVRVMPTCWYALLRFWLRVDNVVVRLRETRIFCAFQDGAPPVVLRERQTREETFAGLRARGAPASVAQYPDAETSSQVLLAAGGPVSVTYDKLVIPA